MKVLSKRSDDYAPSNRAGSAATRFRLELGQQRLRRVTGQNGIGQNGTNNMVRIKWNGQNASNFYRFQFNSIKFLFNNHKS